MTNQLLSREAKAAPAPAPAPAAIPSAAEVAAPLPRWKRLLATPDDRAALVLRLVLGGVMLPHGAQKVLGWWGGGGLAATMEFFTGTMGVPAPLAALVIAAESLGALALVAGAATRVAALGIAAVMAGAVAMVHAPNGFFMNWFGNQKGEGFEYHLLALGITAALVVRGGGAWSVDRRIAKS